MGVLLDLIKVFSKTIKLQKIWQPIFFVHELRIAILMVYTLEMLKLGEILSIGHIFFSLTVSLYGRTWPRCVSRVGV